MKFYTSIMQKVVEIINKLDVYIALSAIYLLLYIVFGNKVEYGITSTSPFYTHITYIFVHANFLHLAMNIFSLGFTLKLLKKMAGMKYYLLMTIGLISSFVASFISAEEVVTVGISGVIYALLGTYCYLRFDKLALKLLGTLTIINIIQYIFGSINVKIHLFSLIFGFICTALWDSYYVIKFVINEKRKDTKRRK